MKQSALGNKTFIDLLHQPAQSTEVTKVVRGQRHSSTSALNNPHLIIGAQLEQAAQDLWNMCRGGTKQMFEVRLTSSLWRLCCFPYPFVCDLVFKQISITLQDKGFYFFILPIFPGIIHGS